MLAVAETLVGTPGTPAIPPVPLNRIVCVVDGLAFKFVSVSTSDPLILPLAVGVKFTSSVQETPEANVPAEEAPLPTCGQLLEPASAKFGEILGFWAPPVDGMGNVRSALPLFANVTVFGPSAVSVVPTAVAVAKFRLGGVARGNSYT